MKAASCRNDGAVCAKVLSQVNLRKTLENIPFPGVAPGIAARSLGPERRKLMPHALQKMLVPVPSDIEIAQAATPLPIDQIAAESGILPEELELYGKSKAKVHLSIRDRLNVPNG